MTGSWERVPSDFARLCRWPLQSRSNRPRNRAVLALGALNVTGETSRIVLPSATGFAARQAIAILRRRDVPIASLLNRAGVSESDIDDPQHRIGAMAEDKLLEYAAETLKDSEFGLHLAQKANPREVGLLFYVASAADDIGDALALAARYCRIVNERCVRSLFDLGKE
jgi:hypothetical protein